MWGGGGLTKIGVDLRIVQNHFSHPYFEQILYTFGQHRFSGLDARDGYGDIYIQTFYKTTILSSGHSKTDISTEN